MTHPYPPNELALREALCTIGRNMRQYGYIDGSSGNISARLGDNRILMTPSGVLKHEMTPDVLIEVDLDARRIDAPNAVNAGLRPSTETLMHVECYRQRPDVNGVVHAHPVYTTALTIVGYDFSRPVIAESVILLGDIAVAPYTTPAGKDNQARVAEHIAGHNVLLLAHHGSITVGRDVWEAYIRLETLEHCSRILHAAEQVGGARPIPTDLVEALHQIPYQIVRPAARA